MERFVLSFAWDLSLGNFPLETSHDLIRGPTFLRPDAPSRDINHKPALPRHQAIYLDLCKRLRKKTQRLLGGGREVGSEEASKQAGRRTAGAEQQENHFTL